MCWDKGIQLATNLSQQIDNTLLASQQTSQFGETGRIHVHFLLTRSVLCYSIFSVYSLAIVPTAIKKCTLGKKERDFSLLKLFLVSDLTLLQANCTAGWMTMGMISRRKYFRESESINVSVYK